MEKVTVILNRKESHFHYISPLNSIDEALGRMTSEGLDHLAVVDEDGRFMGVITEHDIACKAILRKISLTRTPVKKLVNQQLPIASSADTVEQCLQRMRQHNVKLLPVFDGFQFRGIVTSDDILQEVVRNRSQIFDEEAVQLA